MKALTLFCCAAFIPFQLMSQDLPALRKEFGKLNDRGMHRDAVNIYKEKLMPVSDAKSGEDLQVALNNLQQLNAVEEFDGLVENAIATHADNSALLIAAAQRYRNVSHYGRLIAGDFERSQGGYWHGSRGPDADPEASAGSSVQTEYRDHIRSLQLHLQALKHAQDDSTRSGIWSDLAQVFRRDEAWKLQTLTPIDTLPEWGEPGPQGGTEGAPWAKDSPVLYEVPKSWEAAKNNGERWRFALAEQTRLDPKNAASQTLDLARFSASQFGTETLASYGWWRSQDQDSAKGILEMDTLAEDECLAKTSDGVRRFKLPASQHFIALYRSILGELEPAGDALTQVFLNRRQHDKARAVLEQTIAKHGPGDDDHRKKLLKQITGNWASFGSADTVPAGVKPKLPLTFRNASNITLTAAPVDMEAVLNDTLTYLKENPSKLDDERIDPSEIANRLIKSKQSKYLGKTAATWETKLTPLDKHRDTSTELEVPLDQAGAWWITGKISDGNEFHTLVWIVDSVLVRRDVAGKIQWWIADAATGAPVELADVSFFGYRTIELKRKIPLGRRMEVKWREFSRVSDADGKTLLKPGDWDDEYQWLAIARSGDRSPAFYGFQSLNVQDSDWQNKNRDLSYGITDRPLYKPGDTVHLKFFLRNLGYFEPDETKWANKTGKLTLTNGRGEEAMKIENLKTDDLGAVETEVIIPEDAPLGNWSATFEIKNKISADVSFQVEEYRKPEYEVKVEAPSEPVKLGDKFTATIKANYFHGAPVRNAKVEIIVKRSTLGERWFPAYRWDWLYGSGAWWNGSQATWHPTWKRWGCTPPNPPWWHGNRWTPDELVLKQNIAIGEDGTAKVEIDTAPAKQIHGDMDARYSIEARVVDASRREERGNGSVIAARKPFEIVLWTDRGHAKSGEEIEATISSATLAGKPVVGAKGTLKLYQLVMGANDRIDEKEIQSWPAETNAEGIVKQKFVAPATGQYRLAASLSFNGGEATEGATILNIHSPGRDDPKAWKFGPLELVSDKTEYQANESVKLRVNSDHANAHVWLFLHIAGSSGSESRRIQLSGKSTEVEVPLTLKDMPNMFIEGVTVHGAQVHSAVKQILLPPVSKMIEVTLEPAKTKLKPQEKSSLRVTLKDADGKPVTGTTVLAIYDKSLEAITGGSNVGPIHENFWKWRNGYNGYGGANSLPSSPGNLLRPKVTGMQQLGQFGYGGSDEYASLPGIAFGGVMPRRARAEFKAGNDFISSAPAAMAAEGITNGLRSGDQAINRKYLNVKVIDIPFFRNE